jgi:hypothetical protein
MGMAMGVSATSHSRRSAIAGKLDVDMLSYLMDIAANLNFLFSEPLPG